MITIRVLHRDEIEKMRQLDRTEVVRTGYRQAGREIVSMDVEWDSAGWRDGDGEHSFGRIIRFARTLLDLDGTAFGAFDGDRLVGIAVYRPDLSEGMSQLGLLHVSNGYRRQGIAARLYEEVLALAHADGVDRLYVSATPSESAVGFYLSRGFRPTDTPDPELLEKEPDDIHLIAEL